MDIFNLSDKAYEYFAGHKTLKKLLPYSYLFLLASSAFMIIAFFANDDFLIILTITKYFFPIGIVLAFSKKEYFLILSAFCLQSVLIFIAFIQVCILEGTTALIISKIIDLLFFSGFSYLTFLIYKKTEHYEHLLKAVNRRIEQHRISVQQKQEQRNNEIDEPQTEEIAIQRRCGKCNMSINGSDMYCPNCGNMAPLEPGGFESPNCFSSENAQYAKLCTNCGVQLFNDDMYCYNCGNKTEASTSTTYGDQTKSSRAGEESTIKQMGNETDEPETDATNAETCPDNRCSDCGTPLGEDDAFCMNCGRERVREETPNGKITVSSSKFTKCKKCGTDISSDDTFCIKCGARI